MSNGGCDNGSGCGNRSGSGFALLVVLFILLIIIGASFHNRKCDGGYGGGGYGGGGYGGGGYC